MSRANESALDALHAAVAKVLTEGLQTRTEGDKPVLPSPQMIAQAIKFLKDNGIDTPATSRRMMDLSAALDALDSLDPEAPLPN